MDTKIEEVEQEIRKVELQIVDVERQLTKDMKEAEVDYWRDKEKQLRKKEEGLRKREEQLREEKLLRLKADTSGNLCWNIAGTREDPVLVGGRVKPKAATGAGLLTLQDWLNQTLQNKIPSFGPQPGFQGASYVLYPEAVRPWDILPEIERYIAAADAKDPKYTPVKEASYMSGSNEARAVHGFACILGAVGRLILGDKFSVRPQKYSSLSTLRNDMNASERAIALASDGVGRSDLVLKLEGRLFSVVEMKRPSMFRTCVDEDCSKLCEAYENMSTGSREGPRSHILLEPILQLYKYLVHMQLGYGIISSLDLSYFVYREGDILFISEAITGRNLLLGAIAYFMTRAAYDKRNFPVGKNGKEIPEECLSEHSGGNGESQESSDMSYVASRDNVQSLHMRLRSGKGGSGLQETPASHLHLAAHPFATGWSGSIVRGTYEGHRVAVKLAPFGSDRAQALLTEIRVYHKLKKHWGKYVPMLVSHGTTANGKVVYIATQLIYGHAPGIEPLTPEVARATFDALNAVHASGILHGDIRRDNILVVKGGQGSVRLIDFGFSRPITSTEDCKRECAQLLDIIGQFSRSSHWTPILGEIGLDHLIETCVR